MEHFDYTLEIDKEDDTVMMNVRINYRVDDPCGEYQLHIESVDMWCETMKMYIPVDESVWRDFSSHIEDTMEDEYAKVRRQRNEMEYIEAHAGEWS
jgi:hypothetical protein